MFLSFGYCFINTRPYCTRNFCSFFLNLSNWDRIDSGTELGNNVKVASILFKNSFISIIEMQQITHV